MFSLAGVRDAWRETSSNQVSASVVAALRLELYFDRKKISADYRSVRYWACALINFSNFLHVCRHGEEIRKPNLNEAEVANLLQEVSFEKTVMTSPFPNNITEKKKRKRKER